VTARSRWSECFRITERLSSILRWQHPLKRLRTPNGTRSMSSIEECEWKQGESAVGTRIGNWSRVCQREAVGSRRMRACGSKEEELLLDAPVSVSPSGGKPGQVGSPYRRKHAARQQTTLSRIDAAGYPHKRAAAPLCIPHSVFWPNGVDKQGPSHGSRDRQGAGFSLWRGRTVKEHSDSGCWKGEVSAKQVR
jgi:hypothetical protein